MLKISTPCGDRYEITDAGEIVRLDIQGFKPSGQWLFLGLQHVKRNELIPFHTITADTLKNLTLLYKNGKPQYTVRDKDHGTTRVWGNTKSHGVKYISVK